MALETGYQVEILSNPITMLSVSPLFVTGLIDAEGSFILKMSNSITDNNIPKIRVQPTFEMGLHIKDMGMLKSIAQFFVGNIRISGNTCYYSVTRLSDLINVIIPHFSNYPLQTQKLADFLL
jgi:hypothetical protein